MEITIKRYSRKLTYENAATLDEFWDLAKRTERSLDREQRRHWDGRECDEYIIAAQGILPYCATKEVRMSAINQLQQECVRFLRRTYTLFRCRAALPGALRPSDAMGSCTPQTPCTPAEKEPPALRLFLFCGSGIVSARLALTLKTQI